MHMFISRVIFCVVHGSGHVICVYVPRLVQALGKVMGLTKSSKEPCSINVIYEGDVTQKTFLLDTLSNIPYTSPPYSGHLGTVLCALRPPQPINYERQTVDGADGNPICLDWFPADTESNKTTKGIMIIFPGLASWSQTNYVQHFVWHAHNSGIHCCVFNARGMGDTPLTQPRIMSAVWTDDIRLIARTTLSKSSLSLRFGSAAHNVWGVGFSLGGVILSKFLSEEGQKETQNHPFDAALILNSPLDTLAASHNISLPKNLLYQRNMTAGLVKYIVRHEEIIRSLPGVKTESIQKDSPSFFKKLKTVYDVDKYIVAPHNKFSCPEEYYAAVNTLTSLLHSKIPTLCVSALDDPVTGNPTKKQLQDVINTNNNVAFLQLPHGGHLGYIGYPVDEWNDRPNIMEVIACNICAKSSVNKN
ncbi:Serine aminopeptidase [Trypanosoma melophagium]|uniref:Serine aminopeptidase n=1 Tax=Trypanosoma melophagium TaxID=715481 RepID=UPI00351A8391|nr:Serine aminopeptidase [Trypanosoma melophagium]